MIEQPDENHIAALAVDGGHRAAVIADRCRYTVVAVAMAQVGRAK